MWIGWAFLGTGTAFFIASMLYVERETWRKRVRRTRRAREYAELVTIKLS